MVDNVLIPRLLIQDQGLDIPDVQIEKWYGTEYGVRPCSKKLLQRLANLEPNPELRIPGPNEFIPEDFKIHGRVYDGKTGEVRIPPIILETKTPPPYQT